MTDQPYHGQQPQQPQQPYEGHEGYDAQVWPGQHQQGEHTQQWQGQTWETQLQPPVPAEETAYLPPQGDSAYGGGYGGQAYGSQPYQPQPQPQQYQPQPQPQQYQPQAQQHQAQPQPYQPQQYQARPQPQPQPYQPQPQTYAPQARPGPQPYAPEPPAAPTAPEPAPATAATAPAAATASTDAPEYGPATLAGNARITDAQRARAEGRSPIIDPGMQPAALTALLGLLLAGSAAVGTYALLVPLIVLQALTAAGWFRLNGMWPARQGIALGFAGALAADAAMLVSDRSPAALLGTLGVWVLLSLVLQLRSHADPDERMYGLMATVAAAALAVVAGGYLAADADAVTVGAVAVAVALVARALPLPTPVSVVVALLAAAGAGIAAGAVTDIGTSGALLGAGAAVCALIGHRVAAYDYPSRFVHFTAGVALPLAASAPAVYLLGRALG
ncbi:hypothetical protein [Streptomyces solaniscabiei]|uniref:hypothetical protein n=1 Tax=Streptomyces solaniscabiei TaxID=2683255 RepID=UPI001CE2B827|nr:hypothetical protein [Streptomyces solaniscabiei]